MLYHFISYFNRYFTRPFVNKLPTKTNVSEGKELKERERESDRFEELELLFRSSGSRFQLNHSIARLHSNYNEGCAKRGEARLDRRKVLQRGWPRATGHKLFPACSPTLGKNRVAAPRAVVEENRLFSSRMFPSTTRACYLFLSVYQHLFSCVDLARFTVWNFQISTSSKLAFKLYFSKFSKCRFYFARGISLFSFSFNNWSRHFCILYNN